MAKWNQLTMTVLGDVLEERERQDDQWGEQNHPSFGTEHTHDDAKIVADIWKGVNAARVEHDTLTWDGIAFEEIHEAMAEPDGPALYAELIQAAAVFACWAEKLRRDGHGPADPRVEVEWEGDPAISNRVTLRARGFGKTTDVLGELSRHHETQTVKVTRALVHDPLADDGRGLSTCSACTWYAYGRDNARIIRTFQQHNCVENRTGEWQPRPLVGPETPGVC